MKTIKAFGIFATLASALSFGYAFLSAGSAQAPASSAQSSPAATISTGQLSGSLTPDGVAVFKNIPFAQAPVGELRWKEPLPAKSWTGVRDVSTFGPACSQSGHLNSTSSEDCLQLNVWTPTWPMKSHVPVLVWFHGGGNTAGSGVEPLFNGESFARRGVVLVTSNYRLGVFGFFSHPDLSKESAHRSSGNYGLLDQIQALRWVQQNIALFGGNPSNVTIIGESAGAADVNTLIASPLTKGLFVRAIAESGPAGAQTPLADAEQRNVKFAESLGITGNQALAKLRAIPEAELLSKVEAEPSPAGPMMGIVVDGWVVPEAPTKIYAKGHEQKVALLIGNNSQEMQGGPGGRGPATTADLSQLISQRFGPLADRARALYGLDGGGAPQPDPEIGNVLTQWTTDSAFRCGTIQELVWHTAAGNTAYEYQFSRSVHGKETLGAAHASEIPFVFGTLAVWQKTHNYNDSDQEYALMMQEYWSNFAKTGNPNRAGLLDWPTFDPNARGYIDFTDAGPVVKEGLRQQVCSLFMENQNRLMMH